MLAETYRFDRFLCIDGANRKQGITNERLAARTLLCGQQSICRSRHRIREEVTGALPTADLARERNQNTVLLENPRGFRPRRKLTARVAPKT